MTIIAWQQMASGVQPAATNGRFRVVESLRRQRSCVDNIGLHP
eukprot:CAMPEP_0178442626 /NCGR_PEP_ID=MMETSP0689_2-20121128/38305_1 /TAXON_ID=160604 /ORGANISM="Amphidinium massartii, Strain CS-259" /LENGTH=42 /DNA_ID= /DNA_START= /DNA_END= /DNA_ORIENTATION=